jgi:hypothetical protein
LILLILSPLCQMRAMVQQPPRIVCCSRKTLEGVHHTASTCCNVNPLSPLMTIVGR